MARLPECFVVRAVGRSMGVPKAGMVVCRAVVLQDELGA